MYQIYTDGSYTISKNKGGWGCVVTKDGEFVDEFSEVESNSTSNRMEMKAVIFALRYTTADCEIYTDSNYVFEGVRTWMKNWKTTNWKNSRGKDVKNRDLWESIDSLLRANVNIKKIKAHSGHEFNERADDLAGNY